MMVSASAAVRANPAKTLSVVTFLMYFGVPRVAETLYFTMFLCLPIAKTSCFRRVSSKTPPGARFAKGRAPWSQTALGNRWPGAAGSDQELKNTVWSRCVRGLAAFAGPKPRNLLCVSSFRLQKCSVSERSKAKLQKALCFWLPIPSTFGAEPTATS